MTSTKFVTLKRLSACACGYPCLDESVPLGTEYEVDPESERLGTLVCGGCRARNRLEWIYVFGRGKSKGGYLPKMIFEEPMTTTRTTPAECPSCLYRIDVTICVGADAEPVAGDLSVCFNCGAINVFETKDQLRNITEDEREERGPDHALDLAVKLVKLRGRIE